MAGFYQTFTTTRTTVPDPAQLLAQLRASDATAGIDWPAAGPIRVKKNTAWTGPQIAFVQNAIDTAPASSPQFDAQAAIDTMSIFEKAIVLTILDQFNLVRSKLSPPLGAIDVPTMIAAIRTKAGTL